MIYAVYRYQRKAVFTRKLNLECISYSIGVNKQYVSFTQNISKYSIYIVQMHYYIIG